MVINYNENGVQIKKHTNQHYCQYYSVNNVI